MLKKRKVVQKVKQECAQIEKKMFKKRKIDQKVKKKVSRFQEECSRLLLCLYFHEVLAISEKKKKDNSWPKCFNCIIFTFVLVCLLEQFGLIHFKRI